MQEKTNLELLNKRVFFPLFGNYIISTFGLRSLNNKHSMKHTILLLTVLFFLCCSAKSSFAQEANDEKPVLKLYPNTFKQFIGNFYIRESRGLGIPVTQIGLYYERKGYKNLYIGAGYMQWEALKIFTAAEEVQVDEDPTLPYIPIIGKLESRQAYKMADGYVFYKYNLPTTRHYINVGIGISYCWGTNLYLKYYKQGTATDREVAYDWREEDYWGLMPVITYDYLLFKNRMNIGLDIKGRYYSGRPKTQYDYGVHIGVNF